MGHPRRACILVLHNRDFSTSDDPEFTSRADVENAARDVVSALVSRGYAVERWAVPTADPLAVVDRVAARAPDLVFNLCESLGGDSRHEAVLPALFELRGLRYTGSGPLALGTALRKDRTQAILRAYGVPTPAGFVVEAEEALPAELPPFPLIVKPTREDASTGIWLRSVVEDRAALCARVDEVRRRYRQPVLVERFIAGRELYVSLLGNGREPLALPLHEIDFAAMPRGAPHIVTYDGKWSPSSAEYRGTQSVRALLSEALRDLCAEVARAAFSALELRDYARIDLRVASDGSPFVIDVNPNCDLSDGAGVARAASFAGLSYPDLIERIVAAARARYERETPHVVFERAAAAPSPDSAPAGRATDPTPLTARPAAAAPPLEPGRAVHPRGDRRRARAHRRRAR